MWINVVVSFLHLLCWRLFLRCFQLQLKEVMCSDVYCNFAWREAMFYVCLQCWWRRLVSFGWIVAHAQEELSYLVIVIFCCCCVNYFRSISNVVSCGYHLYDNFHCCSTCFRHKLVHFEAKGLAGFGFFHVCHDF